MNYVPYQTELSLAADAYRHIIPRRTRQRLLALHPHGGWYRHTHLGTAYRRLSLKVGEVLWLELKPTGGNHFDVKFDNDWPFDRVRFVVARIQHSVTWQYDDHRMLRDDCISMVALRPAFADDTEIRAYIRLMEALNIRRRLGMRRRDRDLDA